MPATHAGCRGWCWRSVRPSAYTQSPGAGLGLSSGPFQQAVAYPASADGPAFEDCAGARPGLPERTAGIRRNTAPEQPGRPLWTPLRQQPSPQRRQPRTPRPPAAPGTDFGTSSAFAASPRSTASAKPPRTRSASAESLCGPGTSAQQETRCSASCATNCAATTTANCTRPNVSRRADSLPRGGCPAHRCQRPPLHPAGARRRPRCINAVLGATAAHCCWTTPNTPTCCQRVGTWAAKYTTSLKVLTEFANHHNRHRPHRSRSQLPPDALQQTQPAISIQNRRLLRTLVLGGAINEYRYAA